MQVMLQAALASSRSKAAVAKTLPKKKVSIQEHVHRQMPAN